MGDTKVIQIGAGKVEALTSLSVALEESWWNPKAGTAGAMTILKESVVWVSAGVAQCNGIRLFVMPEGFKPEEIRAAITTK